MTGVRHVLQVPDAELEELRSRLRRTRWAAPWPGQVQLGKGGDWRAGTDEDKLRRLVSVTPENWIQFSNGVDS